MRHARLTALPSSKQHGRLFCTSLQKRSNSTIRHSATTQRRRMLRVLSQGENTNGSQQQTQTIETSSKELEGARKRKGKSKKRQQEPAIIRRPQAQAQQQQRTESSTSTSGGFAEWREGELLPRGWDKMNPVQKATELYAGKRGALFWANKVAWASLFIIGGAWILFRIVGPVTGLYTLKNDLLSPPNL